MFSQTSFGQVPGNTYRHHPRRRAGVAPNDNDFGVSALSRPRCDTDDLRAVVLFVDDGVRDGFDLFKASVDRVHLVCSPSVGRSIPTTSMTAPRSRSVNGDGRDQLG